MAPAQAVSPAEPKPSTESQDETRPNCIAVLAGAQIQITEYDTFLKLGAGYQRFLSGRLWLDLSSTVLVLRYTNWALDGGVRWKFGQTKGGVRAFVRVGGELAVLAQELATQFVIAARAGGGAGYYSSPGFGMTLEASIALGPAFGDGARFASEVDILLAAEFPF